MLDYFNELRWAVQAYRLADANPAKVASLVVLSLLVAILDSIGLSVLLPVLVYLQGGTEALATKLPFPFDRMYAYSAPYIAGYELFAMVAAAISILCVRYWIYYVQQKRAILMGTHSVSVLRRNIHQAFLESDISFHTRRHAGTRYTAVYTYAQQVGGIIIMLFQALVGGLVCLAYVILLFYVSPLMALATVPILGFILLAYRAMLERGKNASVEYNLHTAKLNDALTEHFQGVRIIKLHNREERTAGSFAAVTDKNLALYARVLMIQALAGATINPILLIAGVGLIYVSMSVLNVDLAVLGTFAVVMFRLLPLLGSLNTLRAGLHAYGPSLDLYFQALSEARQERTILPGKRSFDGLAQGIELQDIGFRYPGADLLALDGASMQIPAGTVVAVVGRSGAGKSTIVDLLARLYDPTAGRILVDGVPLTELDLGSYRASVALVSQEQFLFDATVRENVSFGLEHVLDDAAMEDVLRRAHALEFVRAMPEGLDTPVGERGVMLSGGQRQRLALARALASNPKLLILDEPTSALDSESEQAIQLALAELRGEITILIVAHRFATIRDADLIHVVKDGQVVASGSHATLWRDNEHYRHLSELQAA